MEKAMTPTNETQTTLHAIQRIYDAGKFQQLRLLPLGRFLRHLGDRGLTVFRENVTQDFAEFLLPVEDRGDDEPLFHPYQVWLVGRLRELLSINLTWSSWKLSSRDRLERFIDSHRGLIDRRLGDFRDESAAFSQLLELLSLAEPFYLPRIRGRVSLSPSGIEEDIHGEYIASRKAFDAAEVMSRCGVSAEMVKDWHRIMSVSALRLDDAERWYLLMRHASFEQRDRLRGNLRLAYDYYEIAELLRSLLLDATGERLRAEDEYFGAGHRLWKANVFGAEEINFAERLVLKRILRDYGLDAAYRGFWFVEGDTEVGFFRRFSEGAGVDLEARAVALVNLGGGGDITQRRREVAGRLRGARGFVETLQKWKADEVFTFVSADDDPGIEGGLQFLRNQELLTAGFVKWKGDFEEANFTVDELIAVVMGFMDVTKDQEISITASEVEAERRKADGSGRVKPLGKALEDVARRKPGLEHFSKSAEWGQALAEHALEHEQIGGEPRPAVMAWQRAMSMSRANFKFTLARYECDSEGNPVERSQPAEMPAN